MAKPTTTPLLTTDMRSVPDAAKRLGVAGVTLRKMAAGRGIPFYRVGRRIVFHDADLEAFLLQRRVPALYEKALTHALPTTKKETK